MRVLVLSGGGAKGAMQIACVAELYLKGYRWDAVVGVSAGALNAAGIAFFDPVKSVALWKMIKSKSDVLNRNWISLLWKQGLYSMDPLEKFLKKAFKDIPKPWLDFYIGITNLKTGLVRFEKGEANEKLVPWLLASSCIPGIMEPKNFEADGGVRDTVPLSFAIKDLKADEIDVVMCQTLDRNQWMTGDNWEPSFPKIVSVAERAVDILSSEITYGDIQLCVERNDNPKYRKVKMQIFSPKERPPLDTLDFDSSKIALGLDYGKAMANEPTLRVGYDQ
jgi:predicted acylesterase/phospholipase RssA